MVRIKHRYILLNILYPEARSTKTIQGANDDGDVPYTVQFRQPTTDRMDSNLLLKMVRNGVADLFGDYGSGMVAGSLQVKYFSPATSTAIIRVSRDHYRLVWAALTFTTHLPKPVELACVIQVVRVSGTIKKAEEDAIRRAKLTIKRARLSAINNIQALSLKGPEHSGANERDEEMMDIFPGGKDGIEDVEDEDDEDEDEDDDD